MLVARIGLPVMLRDARLKHVVYVRVILLLLRYDVQWNWAHSSTDDENIERSARF